MALLKLKTSDGEVFEIEKTIAMQSIIIKVLIDDSYSGDDIPLNLRDRPTLAKVLEWCKQHDDASKKAKEEEMEEWEKNFATSLDTDLLYYLFNAVNYLCIKPLLARLAQQAADLMKGKTPEEIQQMFKIDNDFSPEEEIRKDNCWAFM